MAKDPRSRRPGSPEPDEAIDLLRALARRKGAPAPSRAGPRPPSRRAPPAGGEEKLDALKALAERLDMQLRSPGEAAPGDDPLATPTDTPFGIPASMAGPARRAARSPAPPSRDRGERTLLPRFDIQRIIFVVLSLAVLLVAAVGGVMRLRGAPAQRPGQVGTPVAPPAQIVPPIQPFQPYQQSPPQPVPPVTDTPPQPASPSDLEAISKAMSECDKAAAKEPDALYFFILPLAAANPSDQSWRSVALQTVGFDIMLLSAQDALDGLRDRKLYLRSGRYTFAVRDAGSNASFSWTSATGMTRLSKSNVGTIKALRLGFDFSAAQAGPQWSAEFKRDVGACYWVSVLVRQ